MNWELLSAALMYGVACVCMGVAAGKSRDRLALVVVVVWALAVPVAFLFVPTPTEACQSEHPGMEARWNHDLGQCETRVPAGEWHVGGGQG